MAKKKSPKKASTETSLFGKIAEQAVHLKDELIAGKDHLADLAGEKIADLKGKFHDLTDKKPVKKRVPTVKKAAAKKVAPVKKAAAKKVGAVKKAVAKKAATVKRATVKKSAPKKSAPKKKTRR